MVRHLPQELLWFAVRWRHGSLTKKVIIWRLGVPQGAVRKILKPYRETMQFVQRRRSGRVRISTPRYNCVLACMCQGNRFLSAMKLSPIWMRTIRRRCSIRTVRDRLLAIRVRPHRPCTDKTLARRHHPTRRPWTEPHRDWQLRHWQHTVFFDESWFVLYMRDGRIFVRRLERIVSRMIVSHNTSVTGYLVYQYGWHSLLRKVRTGVHE